MAAGQARGGERCLRLVIAVIPKPGVFTIGARDLVRIAKPDPSAGWRTPSFGMTQSMAMPSPRGADERRFGRAPRLPQHRRISRLRRTAKRGLELYRRGVGAAPHVCRSRQGWWPGDARL